jgi:hypothetical protein
MEFYYITNDIQIAKICDENEIIPWIDLEALGKEERQKGMNTVKSNHNIQDIGIIKKVLNHMPLLVRINPINRNSENEINRVIEEGADIIMLPFFKSEEEVRVFLKLVNRRCKTMLLFETRESVEHIDQILCLDGIDKVHIGLNDLSLSYELNFMFELITNGTVDYICSKFNEYGLRYGFGGVARLGAGNIPAEYVILEHVRLYSSQAILSRSFCNSENYDSIETFRHEFEDSLYQLRQFYNGVKNSGELYRNNNHLFMKKMINELVLK